MRFLAADLIFDGIKFLDKETVLVLRDDGVLSEISHSKHVPADKTECLAGILTPGFVNAHCHLELSHMKGAIEPQKGFIEFAKKIIPSRNHAHLQARTEAMQQADKEMWENGVVAVGDICNTGESIAVKKNSRMHYHSFVELLGLQPLGARAAFGEGLEVYNTCLKNNLPASLAPHAPYSTSLELIKLIAEFDAANKIPLSIHNQESQEETDFSMGLPGGFYNLYAYLGIDISWYKAPRRSSIKAFGPLVKNQHSILVHNTCTSAEELNELKSNPVFWCLCPLSNLYIESRLPEFSKFEPVKNNLCLGTDSLASNTQLNMLAEANELLKFPQVFSTQEVLRLLTSQGARALSLEKNYGHLIPGKNTGLNLLQQKNNQLTFLKKLT